MQHEQQVQQALRQAFPEFNHKAALIKYYVSFEFPDKQQHMLQWWPRVIDFLIEADHRAYTTPKALANYLTVHHLKPTPLPNIVQYLARQNVLVPENESAKRRFREEVEKQNSGWMSSLFSLVRGPTQPAPVFAMEPDEKIYSKKIKEFKKKQAREAIVDLFGQAQSVEEFALVRELGGRLELDYESVRELLRELGEEGYIKEYSRGQRQFVVFSPNGREMESKEWCELESMKHCLRAEIDRFEGMARREQERMGELMGRAREQLELGNKITAKALLGERVSREKKTVNIVTRKNVLEGQLTQLEYNEMNKSTLALLQQAQDIFKQTAIDPTRLGEAIERNAEMEQASRETNQRMEVLAEGKEEDDEDVDDMLRELEMEVKQQRRERVVEGPEVRVELEKMEAERVEGGQEGRMEVEQPEVAM